MNKVLHVIEKEIKIMINCLIMWMKQDQLEDSRIVNNYIIFNTKTCKGQNPKYKVLMKHKQLKIEFLM